jgi:hypothetical protein
MRGCLEYQRQRLDHGRVATEIVPRILDGSLHTLRIKECDVDEGAVEAMCHALSHPNCALMAVSWEGTHLSGTRGATLMHSLRWNTSVMSLDISDTGADPEDVASMLEHNRTLVVVRFLCTDRR